MRLVLSSPFGFEEILCTSTADEGLGQALSPVAYLGLWEMLALFDTSACFSLKREAVSK
jgi:hypothetical protein